MGAEVRGEDVLKVLADANERAKEHGEELVAELPEWAARVRQLLEPGVPKTFVPVAAITLVARVLYPADVVDVRETKKSSSDTGYSASAIATKLAAFAANQRIDLRSVSQNPFNGQPFTHRLRIERDMREHPKATPVWRRTYDEFILPVNEMSPAEAAKVLALFFHLARRVDVERTKVSVRVGGKATLDRAVGAIAQFVDTHKDNGKVGQAFVAAVLDLLYGPESVDLGHTQDPSFGKPGDVRVDDEDGTWLFSEVKQQAITHGAVDSFVNTVRDHGGERAAYFALINATYADYVRRDQAVRDADAKGVGLRILESPTEAMDWLLPVVPGSYATVTARLLERLSARLQDAHCPPATLAAFDDLIRGFADIA